MDKPLQALTVLADHLPHGHRRPLVVATTQVHLSQVGAYEAAQAMRGREWEPELTVETV